MADGWMPTNELVNCMCLSTLCVMILLAVPVIVSGSPNPTDPHAGGEHWCMLASCLKYDKNPKATERQMFCSRADVVSPLSSVDLFSYHQLPTKQRGGATGDVAGSNKRTSLCRPPCARTTTSSAIRPQSRGRAENTSRTG